MKSIIAYVFFLNGVEAFRLLSESKELRHLYFLLASLVIVFCGLHIVVAGFV